MTLKPGGPFRNLESIRPVRTSKLPKTSIARPASRRAAQISGRLTPEASSGLQGCIDGVDAKGIRGWLLDSQKPRQPQVVRVLLDGVQIIDGTALRRREDVSEAMGMPLDVGFDFRWSQISPLAALRPVQERRGVLLVCSADGNELPAPFSMVDLNFYTWIEPQVDRLSFVLRTTQIAPPPTIGDEELVRQYFDAAFYQTMYPGAAATPEEAQSHYMREGFIQGFDPHPDFSSRFYLESNEDVRATGINPFVHFLRTGQFEGRTARPAGGHKAETLKTLLPLTDVVKAWRRSDTARVLNVPAMADAVLDELKQGGFTALAVSLSHDDYTSNVGGVQLCLALEQKAFNKDGVAYLHLSPWQALPTLHPARNPGQVILRVLYNGELIGHLSGADAPGLVAKVRAGISLRRTHLVVHALHGHAPEVVSALHHELQPTSAFFWLHDYFWLCAGHNLLRNQVTYCDAPPVGSMGCNICVYGSGRQSQAERLQQLFSKVSFTAIAPSAHTGEMWRQRSSLPVRALQVLEHCSVSVEGLRMAASADDEDATVLDAALQDDELGTLVSEPLSGADVRPIRVAYLGHPTVHKGWPVFRELVRQTCGSGRYEFWHLGTQPEEDLPARFVPVQVSPSQPDAMVRAVEAAGIEVVVQWSQWPETFGIAARECVAAGAMMVVSSISGAVAEFVAGEDAGVVLDRESELIEAFKGPLVAQRVADRRRRGAPVGRLVWSRLTAELVDTVQE